MYTDDGLCRAIYEYFKSRILFVVYKCGGCLPPIPEIGRFFHMSPTAIHSALELPVWKGHVKTAGNQTAVVIHTVKSGNIKEHAAKYFTLCEEGIKDMIQSAPLLMGSLWLGGLRKGAQQDQDKMRNALALPSLGVISVLVEPYSLILGAPNNKLTLNLLWEETRCLRFPYLTDRWLENREPTNTGMSDHEIIKLLREIFLGSHKELTNDLSRFIKEEGTKYLIDSSRISFQRNIHRRKPQIKYSLANHLIREVVKGEYQIGTHLPSLSQIAQEYHVSVATIQRILELLSQMGVTQSSHGKGTLVVMRTARLSFGTPGILGGMSLHLESLQIPVLTIRDITMYIIKKYMAEELGRLIGKFTQLTQERRMHLCFETCLRWINQHCSPVAVCEYHYELQRLLTWGYPVMLYRIGDQNIQVRCTGSAKETSALLCENRLEESLDAWGQIMEWEERETRRSVSGAKPKPVSR